MANQRLRDNLDLLGLSAKEIDVYLTVLEHGEAEVSRIVDESDVSQRHVYQMCEKLDERGLVVLNDHVRPAVVRAQDPESALGTFEERFDELKRDITRELADKDLPELEVELVKTGHTLVNRWRRFVDDATEELFVSIPARRFDQFEPELTAARERDVTVFLLLTDPGLEAFDSDALAGSCSLARSWPYQPRPLLTVDNERAIHDEPKLLLSETAEGSAISLTGAGVAGHLFSAYISNYWPIADAQYRIDPDDLPRSYPRLRNALVHAALHSQGGRDLAATITARRTATEEVVEMEEVPVVEIRQGLVEPFTNRFPIENGISVVHDEETVSVGGISAVIEDYEALDISLQFRD